MTERDDGKFTEQYSLTDVLGVFGEVRGPVVTTSDISDSIGCSPELARQKLQTLHEQGRVDRRKTGRIKVWWVADESLPDVDARLKRLSTELDEPITVGSIVYEAGDKHPVEDSD